MTSFLFFLTIFVTSYFGIASFRRWIERRNLFDVPNDRSSHITPTPRGGGAIIAAATLVSYLIATFFFDVPFLWGFVLGAVIVTTISWLDDVYSIWFVWRFLAHSIAAACLIANVGYLNKLEIPFFATHLELGIWGLVLTFVWIAWLINAYNFMDGIDGIAGFQAIVAGFGWIILSSSFDLNMIFYIAGAVTVASFAFLIHNWQPAKIFMGDVGSAFLGFTFAALPLLAQKEKLFDSSIFIFSSVLFLWFFLFDTIITFFSRLLRRKNVFSAHREHIYQQLVIAGMSHGQVTIIYGLLSLFSTSSVLLSVIFLRRIELGILAIIALLTAFLLIFYILKNKDSLSR